MEAFGLLLHGFAVLMTWKTLALMMVGLVLGIFVGVLPGLGGPNGVAILLPLTFTMDPTSAIVMLSCIYWGALFGGAITSILFNIPGEAWSVATTFDGYPMAQQGRAAEALTAAFTSSFIGSLVAVLLITFLAPSVASFALRFGPPEFFAVYLLTFCSFVGLGREEKHKTIISMTLGLLLAGVGMDTVSGQLRMTFGSSELLRGINFLVAVIGLFGISEILLTMEERLALRGHAASISLRVVLRVWREMPRYWVTLLRSSIIGCWLGITPGGAIAASFMGYNLAKRFAKDKESFGKGRIEGVFAPETAAHASGTAALLPMLALGIPGSGTAAILLGGLMVWGLNPGPLLFVEHKSFVWGLIASMYLGNVVGLVLVLTTVPIFAAILRVPFSAIAPMIVVSCAIGAYAIQNAMFDIWLMLIFGVVGYVFKKIGIPLAPFTLALVLGSRAEDSFRLAMIGAGGDLSVFWSNALVGSITTLALLLLFWPAIAAALEWARGATERPTRSARPAGPRLQPVVDLDGPLHHTVPLQLDAAILPSRRRARAELGRDRPADLQPELHRRGFCAGRRSVCRRGRKDEAGRLVVARRLPHRQSHPPADSQGDDHASTLGESFRSPSWPRLSRPSTSLLLLYR